MNANDPKHILIVDDEADVRAVLKAAFQKVKPDYQVTLASNGFAALGQMFQRSFDLIITDYKMPEMNGLELAEAAHSISPATKILLMSGVNPLLDEESFATAGLAGYLNKPFSIEQMFEKIEQISEPLENEIIAQ